MGLCRGKIRVKAQLELDLGPAIEDNKKYKYSSSNHRAKENLSPLWDGAGPWSLFPDNKG